VPPVLRSPRRSSLSAESGQLEAASRRDALAFFPAAALAVSNALLLDDAVAVEPPLPSSIKSFRQYAPQLQLSGDFYLFDLAEDIRTSNWDDVLDQFKVSGSARFVSVSRMDRDFFSPMRLLAKSVPEDEGGSDLEQVTERFESSMRRLQSVAKGVGGDVTKELKKEAQDAWESGRQDINTYMRLANQLIAEPAEVAPFTLLPSASDDSPRRDKYIKIKKVLAKCQQGGVGVNVCGDVLKQAMSMDDAA